MAHYRIAISACASLGDGPRAAALLHRMQQRGMGYAYAAADAMFACNKSGMGDVALDIFHGLVVESGEGVATCGSWLAWATCTCARTKWARDARAGKQANE